MKRRREKWIQSNVRVETFSKTGLHDKQVGQNRNGQQNQSQEVVPVCPVAAAQHVVTEHKTNTPATSKEKVVLQMLEYRCVVILNG